MNLRKVLILIFILVVAIIAYMKFMGLVKSHALQPNLDGHQLSGNRVFPSGIFRSRNVNTLTLMGLTGSGITKEIS